MSRSVPDPRLARLRRRGRLLSTVTLVILVVLVIGSLGIWLNPAWIEAAVAPRVGISGYPMALTGLSRTLGCLISAVPLAILAYGLNQVRLIFRDFGQGQTVSETLAWRLERFGAAVALQALINPLVSTLLGLTLTYGNPAGKRIIALSLSSHDVISVLVGLLVIGVGAVMREAARIARENEGFI
ncbi:DUF2975 domain-containing protein [Xanthobacter sediminis]|uniref:DUF2975 domain-containing protein n=1 Tax=Xanthobacter sediminis TaxID=3119926 RepID=UPI0037296095